jgi:multidrug efflux pump subunit AcrB
MHNFWIFFLKKRAFTYMLMFAFTVGGLYSLVAIPKESTPEIILPIGIVVTTLRGASATDVEKLITNKVEEQAQNLENIDKVTSSSRDGVSVVTVQFLAKADVTQSIQDLKDAVDKAKVDFPKEADEPNVTKVNFSDQPVLIASVTEDLSPAALANLGDQLTDELKKVKGVSSVDISGTRERQVNVVVKKDALLKYNLRLDQVISALQTANASFPIGNITVADIDYPIKFNGSIDEPNQVGDIAITNNNGAPIYIRDVAFVADGLAVPSNYSRASVNSAPSANALTLSVHKNAGGDVTKITEAIRAKLESLKGGMLSGADVVVSFDRGALVQKDLTELTRTGMETVILVLLVLFLTIGWRESVVAALSIPLSFVVAFIGLYASGNTLNVVSLFSLILAIGILVDSGIVVTEAIHTRTKVYGNAVDAAIASIKEYAWPLIAGTFTTIAVFAPLFFLSGILGKFIASIPFTIIFVLLASIFVALGFVPLIAILFTERGGEPNKFELLQEEYSHKSQEWYKHFLGGVLENRKLQNRFFLALGLGLVFALSLPVIGLVKAEFFPAADQDFVYIDIERPQGTPLAVTDISAREVEEYLYDDPNIDSFVTTVGAASSFNQNGGGSNTRLANITVILKKKRSMTSTEMVDHLRTILSPITSAVVHVQQPANGPPSGEPVTIKFLSDDLSALSAVTDKAETLLSHINGTLDVQSSLRDDGTEFTLTVDRTKAAAVGLSASAVAQTLRAAVSGTIATTIKKQEKDIDVVVKLNLNSSFVNPEDTIKTTIDSIKQIPISTPTGSVLLGSLLTSNIDGSKAAISHESRKRVATVSSKIATGVTALEVTNEFKKREKELNLPESVTIDFGGDTEQVNSSFSDMGLALIEGMVLMLAILVLEFNSFRYTLYLLGIVPLSLIGVLAGLALTGRPLSFPSILGVIALAGVIINHAIILLDSILHRLENKEHGTLHEVIIEAAAVRLRPIFLTTITTAIGMAPLAGAGGMWGPLAYAIMFGLLFAMVLTLILVPLLFYRFPGKQFEDRKWRDETEKQLAELEQKSLWTRMKTSRFIRFIVDFITQRS